MSEVKYTVAPSLELSNPVLDWGTFLEPAQEEIKIAAETRENKKVLRLIVIDWFFLTRI